MTQPQLPQSDSIDPRVLLRVLDSFRNGDFTQRMPGDWTGLPSKVADTLNAVIDMAQETTAEFERVAQFVGKQGKVGERIDLPAMKGSWNRLVDSSNTLVNDLVSPMNEMIRVVSAVADGDLARRFSHTQTPCGAGRRGLARVDQSTVVSQRDRWDLMMSPAIALAVAAVIEILTQTGYRIPTPPAILNLAIVFAPSRGGMGSGLVSTVIAWSYTLRFFSEAGYPLRYSDKDFDRLMLRAVTVPATAVIVGG